MHFFFKKKSDPTEAAIGASGASPTKHVALIASKERRRETLGHRIVQLNRLYKNR